MLLASGLQLAGGECVRGQPEQVSQGLWRPQEIQRPGSNCEVL